MSWTWNKNYKDLGQVEEFYPAYLAVYEEVTASGGTPYNDLFKGRIPGIKGEREDTAIYMLQTLRKVREIEARVAELREAGWRDFDPAELEGGPVRYAGVAEYMPCVGGMTWGKWADARLVRYGHSSVMVLPKGKRTNGQLVAGRLLVKS